MTQKEGVRYNELICKRKEPLNHYGIQRKRVYPGIARR